MLPAFLALTTNPLSPFEPLSGDEMRQAVAILRADGKATSSTRFPNLWLKEPSKSEIRSGKLIRQAYVVMLNPAQGQTSEAVVDLLGKKVSAFRELPGVQPMILQEEYAIADKAVREDAAWQEAMRKRKLTRFDQIHLEPWAPGPTPEFPGRRLMKVLSFLRADSANPYARPIEGVTAVVDLIAKKVVQVQDRGVRPVPPEPGSYPLAGGKPLSKMVVTTPNGSGFARQGNAMQWDKWTVRFGYHPREGLVLYNGAYAGRKIFHRVSLSEISVPYGDPDPDWAWRAAFDVGEYGIGLLGCSMEPGADTPRYAQLLDVTLPTDEGLPRVLPRAISLYERDGGVLWRHWDFATNKTVSRRTRELCLEFMTAVGNYDYQIRYVFRNDASIAIEAELTGIMLAKGVGARNQGEHFQPMIGHVVSPNVSAPNHQHFFSFRLDLDIDGADNNAFLESNCQSGERNAMAMVELPMYTEQEATRDMDLSAGRSWLVTNPGVRNRLNAAVGYGLIPAENAVPYAFPATETRLRAGFTNHHIWATRYKPEEQYAAGDFPNQNAKVEGLPVFISDNEPLQNEDIVIWYTMGINHVPRLEDWPIMPAHRAGFRLIPVGFFDRNPALDAAP